MYTPHAGEVHVRNALIALLALALSIPTVLGADGDQPVFGSLIGRVTSERHPLGSSNVYAYHLSDQHLVRVMTDDDGNFRFDRLPAGLYKVIAFKDGFVPAIALLARSTREALQFLNMELAAEGDQEVEADFWEARNRIPADVLRDLQVEEAGHLGVTDTGITTSAFALDTVATQMQAIAGIDQNPELGSSSMAGGRVGVEGEIADLQFGFNGRFVALQPSAGHSSSDDLSGSTQALSVELGHPGTTDVRVSTVSNQMTTLAPSADEPRQVGLERHQVSWSQAVGERGRSDFAAEYSAESNFFRGAPIEPFGIPEASRSWQVEGSYSTSPSERSTVHTGFRYREREALFDIETRQARESLNFIPAQRVDLFGRGGVQVNPDILVEFGLYSTLRDGSLSLAPTGGMVFRLGEFWRAHASGSFKVHDELDDALHPDFTAALFGEYDVCRTAEQYCYKVSLARQTGEQQDLSLGVVHRRFGETLHLYFNKDFFSRLESIYLVRGDSLPELQFAATRRLTPKVLARLSSNVAAGGGGVIYATDQTSYENQVRYLVTSLDTRFEQTSTGVFVAFHHLAQQLNPVEGDSRPATTEAPEMELERLQVMLTQDLDVLHRLASDWAVHLNMELSRGSAPETDPLFEDEEVRKRVMGGLTVTF